MFKSLGLEKYKNKKIFDAWIVSGPNMLTNIIRKNKLDKHCKIYQSKYIYPVRWHGIKDLNYHKKHKFPEAFIFNYGYSTSGLDKVLGGGYKLCHKNYSVHNQINIHEKNIHKSNNIKIYKINYQNF